MSQGSYSTKYSLISRALDRGDKEAWKELISIYTPFFGHLLTHYSIPTSNHNDVMQEILIEISNSLESFDPRKGKFRSWSSALVRNRCLMHHRMLRTKKQQMNAPNLSEESLDFLGAESEIEQRIETEWQDYIVSLARQRIAPGFSAKALQVFDLSYKGRSIEEIAHETDSAQSSVYNYLSRIRIALTKAISHIMREVGEID